MNVKTIIKNTFILFCITLVAGVSLSYVHGITENAIKSAEQKKRQSAYMAFFDGAEKFQEIDNSTETLEKINSSMEDQGFPGVTIKEALKVENAQGELMGIAISAVSSKGYGGDIQLVMGVASDGTLNGMSVLSMSETAGLGAKCTTSEFQDQFKGIKADKIEYTKNGASESNEIDAISGATITTKAVTNAVNAGLYLANSCMAGLD